jgi:hypothetical protein
MDGPSTVPTRSPLLLNMFPSMASAPSLAPALSLKKLRQPIEKSYGIRAAPKRPARGIVKSVNQERFGESRFLAFLKRKIRDWMAPMERFIF